MTLILRLFKKINKKTMPYFPNDKFPKSNQSFPLKGVTVALKDQRAFDQTNKDFFAQERQ